MDDMISSITGLLKSEKYSDLQILCEGKVFNVHRAIVCTRSKVLAAMMDTGFEESVSRQIKLVEDDSEVISEVIRYIYTNRYGVTRDISQDASKSAAARASTSTEATGEWIDELDGAPLVFHTKVYIAADKYDVPALKILATEKFEKAVKLLWETEAFSQAARLLWENTMASDRLLRDVVAQVSRKNLKILLDRAEFTDLLEARGDFCLDVLRILYSGLSRLDELMAKRSKEKKGQSATS
ncbi:hypothetical protein VTL71DRAFT_5770 [Oculimacula yallundae]|uniref:BTB domain-containing protein n=1 Tax=Oculimacula yallundae TaxID=86028 RepID=A0ABR4BYH7_9HELO